MSKENRKNISEKVKKNKWKIIAVVTTTSSVILVGLLFKQTYDVQKSIKDSELVKRVVGGPLIERLIKNEEIKLSRVDNKIQALLVREVTKGVEKALACREEERKIIIETIADFKDVKDALAR